MLFKICKVPTGDQKIAVYEQITVAYLEYIILKPKLQRHIRIEPVCLTFLKNYKTALNRHTIGRSLQGFKNNFVTVVVLRTI